MKTYCPINFADVLVVDDVENQEALRKRKAYIERQVNTGLYERLLTYTRDNLNNSLWKSVVLNSQTIIELVQDAYKKHPNDAYIIFQLEQVLGQVEYLFDERKNSTESTYQETLRQVEALSTQLSGQKSNAMRYIGLSLIVLGIATIVVLVLLASVPTFGGAFVAGAALMGSGLFALYRGRQKGLCLATSALVDSVSNIGTTLEYFDKAISNKLYEEDCSKLREELKRLLDNGFDPIVLKKALEWANNRHNKTGPFNCEDYETFFKRVADICCVSLTNNYWIQDERRPRKSWPDSSIQNSNQLTKINNDRKNFFTFYGRHTCSVSTLNYFDNFIRMVLAVDDRETIREGLQRRINSGFNPSSLKCALEWARARYDNAQALYPTQPENYNDFFARVADICGVIPQTPLANERRHPFV